MWRRSLVSAAPSAPASGARTGRAAHAQPLPTVALLLLVRWRAAALPWGLSRLVRGESALGAVPGLRFARVLGSGRRGGFGLAPSFERQGLIGFFDDEASARAFAERSASLRVYREHASEHLLALLRAVACRGSWGGQSLAVTAAAGAGGPVASLTRAAIRPRHAARFWRHSPPAQAGVAQAPGCRLAVGLGEAPLLRQATFSLWDDTEAMLAYAQHGAHQRAARAAWGEGHFSEWMFTRFVPVSARGSWNGRAVSVGPHG
jgi:hypothetical protein